MRVARRPQYCSAAPRTSRTVKVHRRRHRLGPVSSENPRSFAVTAGLRGVSLGRRKRLVCRVLLHMTSGAGSACHVQSPGFEPFCRSRPLPRGARRGLPDVDARNTSRDTPGSGRGRVHHGSTSVNTGGATRRPRRPAKRSSCRDFPTSCARLSPPFIRRSTTHNREVGGSNPPGAMRVPQRNAVSRGRRKISSRNPLRRAVIETPFSQAHGGNGLRAARLIDSSTVHHGSTREPTRGEARSKSNDPNPLASMRMRRSCGSHAAAGGRA